MAADNDEDENYRDLYEMCRRGDRGHVRHLLDAGFRADWVNPRDRNRSLLMATASKDSEDACELLIRAATEHANLPKILNLRDTTRMTALHICAKQKAVRVARLLLQSGIDPNATAENGLTPLMICADLGHTEIAKLLLDHPGIQLDMQSTRGFTALMKAVFENKEDLALELIERGARLDLAANSGFTALHLCAQLGRQRLTERILAKLKLDSSAQSNIDRVTKPEFKGNTAFNLAALNGHVEIMKLLKDSGAKIDVRNTDGVTALEQVKRNASSGTAASSSHVISLLDSWYACSRPTAPLVTFEMVCDAVQKGDPILVRQRLGQAGNSEITRSRQLTLLLLSAAVCSRALVELMLEEIGDPSAVNMQAGEDCEKMTPLQAAVQSGSLDCVKLLLDRGASPGSQNSAGCNSLHLCAEFNSPEDIVQLLLSKASMPADAEVRNKEGRTPVEIAAFKGSVDALRELLERQYSGKLGDADLQALTKIHELADEKKQHKASLVVQEFLHKSQPAFNKELWVSQLFTATMERKKDLVEKLLKEAAPYDVQSLVNQRCQREPGWTALMAAAWNNESGICDLLLSHGAKPNERDQTLQVTALHIAVQQNSREVASKLLDRKDTDLNAESKDKRTPLIRAAWLDRLEIGKLLLEKRANVNAQELDGFSALHFCAQENLVEFAELLVSHEINLELKTSAKKQNNTAFTLAAIKGHVKMLELLASARANIYHKSLKGEALELARRAQTDAVVTLLLQLDSEREKRWLQEFPRPSGLDRFISEPGAGAGSIIPDARLTQAPALSSNEIISFNSNSSTVPLISGTEYSMTANPRGICVIINNEEFLNPRNNRAGSQKDVDALARLFKDVLKFRVQIHQNLDKADIMAVMQTIASDNRHGSYNCLTVFLMSHGEAGVLLGSDEEPVKLEDIYALFRQCRSLDGKPKLFFVQACRCPSNSEANVDRANPVRSSTSQQQQQPSPSVAQNKQDFLYSYATTNGDMALRHTIDGSLFVQTLCQVVNQKYREHHLIDMLTMVRANVELTRQVLNRNGEVRQGSVTSDENTLLRQVWFR